MTGHHLQTLGHLDLVGAAFGREKPLLLLAYLSLHGAQPRRKVAQLFWPLAANPMNSLSVAITQLRRADVGLIEASETQVSAALSCDVPSFLAALQAGDLPTAQALYRGPFLADLTLSDLSQELEEWVMLTREGLADHYRSALLHLARQQAAQDLSAAAHTAAAAYALSGTTPLTPAALREVYSLLSAAGHAQAAQVRQEAREVGLPLELHQKLPEAAARALLGRQHELERIGSVGAGESLWLRGLRGLGKSALLRAAAAMLGGHLLPGQSGRPYQTLRPLSSAPAPTTDDGWFELLTASKEALLLDDWEAADPESRRVLLRTACSRAAGPLIFSSRDRSPLGSGSGLTELLLRPVAPEVLGAELHAQTGGLPALIHAAQHGESLPDTLATLLSPLSPRLRQVLACLALQDRLDQHAIRRALQLGPEELAQLQETLGLAGLWQGGEVAARSTVRAWLSAQPSLEAEVLCLLAPQLAPQQALPLYLRAQALTGSSELPGFQAALAVQAAALLADEQESQAEALLAQHAAAPETWLLHARALDALGEAPPP